MNIDMRKKLGATLLVSCLILPQIAHAQGAAPSLFDVREVIIEPATLTDPKSSDSCSITREKVATALAFAFRNTTVPATPASDAKPLSLGVARINLVPEISTYATESLDCVSWVRLSAQSKTNALIAPVTTLRAVNVLYWQQNTRVISSVSTHDQQVIDTLQKMAQQFAQQYQVDQPPALPQ